MPEKIFYEIFNGKTKITDKNIKLLVKELEDLKGFLETKNDIDNLKVLKNKIELVLKKEKKKIEKKHKKALSEIADKV
jgi:hypothetical protein